jgi:hypothetical protein
MGKGHEVKDNLNDQPLIVRITLKLVEKGGSNIFLGQPCMWQCHVVYESPPCSFIKTLGVVGTRADPGFNAQEGTNKALTTGPFGNTCEADEVSPEVEAEVVTGLRCLQP